MERQKVKRMTYREKLQMEQPEDVNEAFSGGCRNCPATYGYEKKRNCEFWESDEKCAQCWNREMPNTEPKKEVDAADYIEIYTDGHKKGYDEGLNDAWELAQKCVDLEGRGEDNELMFKIFNTVFLKQLFNDNTPQEAFAKMKAYEDSKIEVGDVVVHAVGNHPVLVTKVLDNNYFEGINEFGSVYSYRAGDEWKKTGKHIDIKSFLEQIGE